MHDRDLGSPAASSELQRLEQEVRVLSERLAFYEGFDQLIQDNVAHARELFRLAAQERGAATVETERAKRESVDRHVRLRAELEAIGQEVADLGKALDALARRVASALEQDSSGAADAGRPSIASGEARLFTVVAHGVPSASGALSLQRFVASLPQVADVAAREFAGGVLRLDARVRDPLLIDQFRSWDAARPIEPLTERPDVVEFAVDAGSG